MGTIVVEFATPAIKLSLLCFFVSSWWPGCFGFERLVHSLVLSVLLGMRRLDELWADAKLDPPDRQAREPAKRDRRERHTVVGANGIGQSVLAEQPFERFLDRNLFGRAESFAGEYVSAVLIGDRQRIAVVAVAHEELAFEVGGPQCVRRGGGCRRFAWMLEPATPPMGVCQAGTLEDLARCAA